MKRVWALETDGSVFGKVLRLQGVFGLMIMDGVAFLRDRHEVFLFL